MIRSEYEVHPPWVSTHPSKDTNISEIDFNLTSPLLRKRSSLDVHYFLRQTLI